jgi:transcriptional regulator with XRE-family HTH domain
MEKIINNIIRISKKKGLSHENVAFELGITQPAYTKLLQNKTKLTVERMYKIAEILEVNVTELQGLDLDNQFNQTNKDSATGHLYKENNSQQIENYYQENKEQNQRLLAQHEKIVALYEQRLQDKETMIEMLRKKNGL